MIGDTNSNIRRGLVLEGGGAKGAWQFGALQALNDAGIKFDCVSGTSVGALNGALWAAGRLDLGEELWMSLDLKKIFSLRPFAVPIFLIGFLPRIFYAYVKGYLPQESSRVIKLALFFLMELPVFSLILLSAYLIALQFFIGVPLLLFAFWRFAVSIKPAISDELNSRHLPRAKKTFYILSLIYLGFFILYLTISDVRKALDAAPITALMIVALAPFVIYCLGAGTLKINITLFNTAPLDRIITELVKDEFKVLLFVTFGWLRPKYFDPDNIIFGFSLSGRPPLPLSTIYPFYFKIYTEYVELFDANDTRTVLMASSALPLGILPWRKGWDSDILVDGGVIDNIPWFPLIEEEPCDEIVIVGCNPIDSWDDREAIKKWQYTERLERVQKYELPKFDGYLISSVIKRDPPEIEPFRDPNHWPRRVIIIAPDKSLGTFLSGTLNFSTEVARKRVAAGYEKASQIIQATFNTTSDGK